MDDPLSSFATAAFVDANNNNNNSNQNNSASDATLLSFNSDLLRKFFYSKYQPLIGKLAYSPSTTASADSTSGSLATASSVSSSSVSNL